MTPQRLAEIKERVEKATKGEWPDNNSNQGWHWVGMSRAQLMANRHFIAHSRTDIPDLLEHVKGLEGRIKAAQDFIESEISDAAANVQHGGKISGQETLHRILTLLEKGQQ